MATRKSRTPSNEVRPDHPLLDLIPDEVRYEAYASRMVGGVKDFNILEVALETRHNVAIFGPTGCAKTSLVMAFAALKKLPMFTVACNGAADPNFIFGGWRPQPDGTFVLRPGPVYYCAKYGGIILLDELNFMPPKISAVMHAPMDTRRTMIIPEFDGAEGQLDALGEPIESVFRLHPLCMIVGAWNPGYTGTYSINEALFNRFNHKIAFDYRRDVEDELVESPTLLDLATALRDSVRAGTLHTPVSTNSIMEFEDNAKEPRLGFAYAMENFITMFADDERQAVREIVRQKAAAIKSELGV